MTEDELPAVKVWDESTEGPYRTCSVCGADCEPEHLNGGEHGIRIAFVCAAHGVHSFIDPFEGRR